MKRFTETHEWVEEEQNVATVGVTDHAQKELGDIVYVELPELESVVSQGGELAVLESTKAAADVYAPISGRVVAVNEALNDSPELINSAAENGGWICRIAMEKREEMEELLDKEAYQDLL